MQRINKLPMQKNFTLNKSLTVNNSIKIKPKESTINFIKQFARVCKMKQMTQTELGIFILN